MKWPLMLSLALVSFSCGSDDDDPSLVEYASLTVDATTDTDDGTLSLTGVETCTLDTDTALFTGVFTNVNGARLEVRIRSFISTGGTYICTQASGNESGDIGLQYDSCGVFFRAPNSTDASLANTYAMYRNSTNVQDFTYAGTCTVTTTYANNRVNGGITCDGMVQTHLNGSLRNPIDSSVNASLADSTFFCDAN